VSDVADWEPVIGVGIIAMALALDWGLWRHHSKEAERELDRFAREAARNSEKADGCS
jgi:hypothetical protein